MRGIAGIRRFGRPVDADLLARIAKQLVHRGPDDIGFWSAHTRLSIIDLGAAYGSDSFVGEHLDHSAVRNLLAKREPGDRNEQARISTLLSPKVWHREITVRAREIMRSDKYSARKRLCVEGSA